MISNNSISAAIDSDKKINPIRLHFPGVNQLIKRNVFIWEMKKTLLKCWIISIEFGSFSCVVRTFGYHYAVKWILWISGLLLQMNNTKCKKRTNQFWWRLVCAFKALFLFRFIFRLDDFLYSTHTHTQKIIPYQTSNIITCIWCIYTSAHTQNIKMMHRLVGVFVLRCFFPFSVVLLCLLIYCF